MKVGDAFPSRYLKTADLNGRRVLVTIARVEIQDISGGERNERKPVVYFRGKDKGLVLNKVNASSITEIARTDEMDRWPGVSIVLYQSRADYQGRRVDCIRVDPPTDTRREQQTPPPPPEAPGAFVATDDDVPFVFAGLLPFLGAVTLLVRLIV